MKNWTAKELIDFLGKFPPDTPVCTVDLDDVECSYHSVENPYLYNEEYYDVTGKQQKGDIIIIQ